MDLAATLQAGRPVSQRGLLAEADGGFVVLAMAERIAAATTAHLTAVLDTREVIVERHGMGSRCISRVAVVALDEGEDDTEQLPARLLERLAFPLALEALSGPTEADDHWTRADIAAARIRLPAVDLPPEILEGLCAAALALGVDSIRATWQACLAARAIAALDARDQVSAQDASIAAAVVLSPRATRMPAPPQQPDAEAAPPPPEPGLQPDAESKAAEPPDAAQAEAPPDDPEPPPPAGPISDMVLEAALASMPPGLLAALALGHAPRSRAPIAGRSGVSQQGRSRGRPVGVRRGPPEGGARLNLIETLRAAAPWQGVRRREAPSGSGGAIVRVRPEDFHVWRFKERSETTAIFLVDASGSSALNRLAEMKGAVELLLAECYVRRDSVAVLAFRGAGAEVLLPPTRSLVRAKRSLAGLPGGGGTPLASGLDAASDLADAVRRRGATPVLVVLTDGRANVSRDGKPGRARAMDDAVTAAQRLRAASVTTILVDTSPQPQEAGSRLAQTMAARYLPLPHAGAATLSQVVRDTARHVASSR
jgi:magnesium chelatase subunit D